MQFSKYLFLFLLTVGSLTTASAQKAAKFEKKAEDKTEQLNKQIMTGDKDLVLTDEQKGAITAEFTQMFADIRQAKKGNGTAQEIKAAQKDIRKATMNKVVQELLTKEQRQARRVGKE